ncbi:MAG TPA: phage holin family protein [Burkholderiales bacterium]|nr:phage holin family protein [Burkholderiales bacterium]
MSEHDTDGAPSRGLFDSLKELLATLTALAQTRLELVGTELEEQVARLAILLVWSIVALFLVFTAIVLAAVAIVIVFWDEHRVLVAFGLAGGMALLAGGSILYVINQLKQRPRMFQATLEELEKDRQRLE